MHKGLGKLLFLKKSCKKVEESKNLLVRVLLSGYILCARNTGYPISYKLSFSVFMIFFYSFCYLLLKI